MMRIYAFDSLVQVRKQLVLLRGGHGSHSICCCSPILSEAFEAFLFLMVQEASFFLSKQIFFCQLKLIMDTTVHSL